MTSTSNKLGPIYFEFPDFGFGPASTSLELISRLTCEFDCRVISTGAALELARVTFPELSSYDFDTFDAAGWPKLRAQLSPPAIIISNTNLPFAAWAVEQGYLIGLMDTLHWMWDEFPESLRMSFFHVAQYYFGSSNIANRCADDLAPIYTKPIINESRWTVGRPAIQPGKALIAFGGMKLPLDAELPAKYVRWVLESVLSFLFESDRVNEAHIVGGMSGLEDLVPRMWRDDFCVRVHGPLSPSAYREALLSAEYQFLTPGLTSIYESQAANISPLFLPGFSMSQVLQAFHLRHGANYAHIAEWPSASGIYLDLTSCSEEEGVRIVSEMIHRTISQGPESRKFLIHALQQYFATTTNTDGKRRFPSLLANSKGLRSIHEVVRDPLKRACDQLSRHLTRSSGSEA